MLRKAFIVKNLKEEVSDTVDAKLSTRDDVSGLKVDELRPSMQAVFAKVGNRLP